MDQEVNITDYCGRFVYEEDELRYILTDNGRIIYENSNYEYNYFLKDHLGNIRIVFDQKGNVLQDNSYYPFGMQMSGLDYSTGTSPENKYLYNGKELQDDFELDWYDYGARMYDAQIGRWHMMDPLAEIYYSQSPYHFAGNNPMKFIDLNGMNYNPIYDEETSEFLGTDDKGLQGDAIIMNKKDFNQGMAHEDAMKVGNTLDNMSFDNALAFANNGKFDNFLSHYNSLSRRPDWDGFVTIEEGIQWAKSNPEALDNHTPDNMLYLDASKLDFGNISSSSFQNLNVTTPINLLNKGNLAASTVNARLRATVYALGRVDMQLHNRSAGTVSIVNNRATDYDWNTGGSKLRSILINAERWRTGLNDNNGFRTYYYGLGKLNK